MLSAIAVIPFEATPTRPGMAITWTGESVSSLIKDPSPGMPVPPILPPQDGYLFLDKAKFHASFRKKYEAMCSVMSRVVQ
jgi:hypothetical protein